MGEVGEVGEVGDEKLTSVFLIILHWNNDILNLLNEEILNISLKTCECQNSMNASMLKFVYRIDKKCIGPRKGNLYGPKNWCIEKSFVFGVTRFETWSIKSKKSTFSIVQLFQFVRCENSTFSFRCHLMITSLFHFLSGANVAQMYKII